MSMNIRITVDGEEIDVIQTPSHITYMCMMTHDGYSLHLKRKKAKRALQSYLVWVQHVHPNAEPDARLRTALIMGKKIEVYAI